MNAQKDKNFVNSLTAVLNGVTIKTIAANPITHKLEVNTGTSGTDLGPADALKDANHVPTLIAISSADGKTPVVVYSDTNGNLMVQST